MALYQIIYTWQLTYIKINIKINIAFVGLYDREN